MPMIKYYKDNVPYISLVESRYSAYENRKFLKIIFFLRRHDEK